MASVLLGVAGGIAAYKSAELGTTVRFPPAGIDDFVPKVAKGTWRP